MPNQKISELTAVTSPSINDVLPVVNEGTTKKITVPNLVNNTLSGTMLSLSGVQLPGNFLVKSVSANNLFVGNNATGNNNLRNSNNLVFGINSANSLSASRSNVVMGADSTKNAVFLNSNIFLGDASGGGMGFCFGSNFTSIPLPPTIENNIVMGTRAGFRLSQASYCYRCQLIDSCGNVFYQYFQKCGTSKNNIFLGDHSGHAATYSYDNIMIGVSAGRGLTCGSDNIFMGRRAGGLSRDNASRNLFIGLSAGIFSTGTNSIAMGIGAGRCTNGGSVSIGYKANYFGCRDTINIGNFAGYYDCGYDNINIGKSSNCRRDRNSTRNVIIGSFAGTGCGCQNCTNVIIGDRAGQHNTNNSKGNVLIGPSVGSCGVGCNNVAIGNFSGGCILHNNVTIGVGVGGGPCFMRYSIAIGYRAMNSITSGGSTTIAIGNRAGYKLGNSNTNIFIGDKSGCIYGSNNAIDGCCNIFIGHCSATNRISNCLNGNIMIGHCNFASGTVPLSSTISIGNCTRPNQSNQLAIGSEGFPLGTSTTAGASAGFLNVLLNGTERKIMFFNN